MLKSKTNLLLLVLIIFQGIVFSVTDKTIFRLDTSTLTDNLFLEQDIDKVSKEKINEINKALNPDKPIFHSEFNANSSPLNAEKIELNAGLSILFLDNYEFFYTIGSDGNSFFSSMWNFGLSCFGNFSEIMGYYYINHTYGIRFHDYKNPDKQYDSSTFFGFTYKNITDKYNFLNGLVKDDIYCEYLGFSLGYQFKEVKQYKATIELVFYQLLNHSYSGTNPTNYTKPNQNQIVLSMSLGGSIWD